MASSPTKTESAGDPDEVSIWNDSLVDTERGLVKSC